MCLQPVLYAFSSSVDGNMRLSLTRLDKLEENLSDLMSVVASISAEVRASRYSRTLLVYTVPKVISTHSAMAATCACNLTRLLLKIPRTLHRHSSLRSTKVNKTLDLNGHIVVSI